MPTLEELKSWFAGNRVKGLPKIKDGKPVTTANDIIEFNNATVEIGDDDLATVLDSSKIPKKEKSKARRKTKLSESLKSSVEERKKKAIVGKYTISIDGKDAMIEFGKHKGTPLSDIAKIDRTYLKWMLTEEFPRDLKDVCRYLLRK